MPKINNRYPTGPLTEQYDIAPLMQLNLYSLKSIADLNGVQIDVSFKPDGLIMTFIKKRSVDKGLNKVTEFIDNSDLYKIPMIVNESIRRVMF